MFCSEKMLYLFDLKFHFNKGSFLLRSTPKKSKFSRCICARLNVNVSTIFHFIGSVYHGLHECFRGHNCRNGMQRDFGLVL